MSGMATHSSSSRFTDSADGTVGRTPVQKAAMAVGVVFLLVGVLGFIPGITSNYDQLTFMGHDSTAKLIGVFQVSILHNLVHVLFGIAGILAARTASASKGYLIVGGVIYLALWIYGLVVDPMSNANFVPVNNPDNWLHLVLGLGMIALGFAVRGDRRRVSTGAVDSR
jgi:hypothetical protein